MTTSADADAAPAEFWDEVRIAPIKVALPNATVGYTLRAYRPARELRPTEVDTADDDDPFAARERQRAEEAAQLLAEQPFAESADAPPAEDVAEPDPADFADEEDAEAESKDAESGSEETEEESPVFLSHRGRLLLFADPETLVAFVGSDAPHDLAQLDTWETAAKRMQVGDVVVSDDDVYGLDLVVENLRGGHDAWDVELLIAAGEFARDAGWALRLEPVITALAPGSPLDDLDEALRAAAAGGLKGMLGRRRLRGIGAQQASLGWRTIIGKISAAVDWRD